MSCGDENVVLETMCWKRGAGDVVPEIAAGETL